MASTSTSTSALDRRFESWPAPSAGSANGSPLGVCATEETANASPANTGEITFFKRRKEWVMQEIRSGVTCLYECLHPELLQIKGGGISASACEVEMLANRVLVAAVALVFLV